MKVVVVGGAGRVGRRVVSELSRHPGYPVTVADRVRPDDAVAPSVGFIEIDLTSPESTAEAIAGADVVVNTAGPFDKWGAVVLDAAIAAGVDYIDVCDDPEPTLELLTRSAAAKSAGVRAIVGLGVSPGLTNFLAVIAARELERTDLLATFWGQPREGMDADAAAAYAAGLSAAFSTGRAAYTHLIAQASSYVPLWRGGELVRERAWKTVYRVTAGQGESGLFRVIGHPEPVTLPRAVDVVDCINIGTVNAGADRLMLSYLDRVADGQLGADAALEAMAGELRKHPERLITTAVGATLPCRVGAAAVGRRSGTADGVLVMPGGPLDGSMSLETARPAVVGVLNIDRVAPGVHAPETAFDAEDYLSHYAAEYWDSATPYLVDKAGPDAVVAVER